ncbi:MAG: transporter substrate-binding domain-containing protein [Pseudomonadota bacterium]
MNKLALLLCVALAGLPAWGAPAPAEPIRIATSELPPFSIDAAPGAPGALHEMVAELMRRTHTPAHIEFVPWQRAIYLSANLSRTAIFPLTRTPERESQYRWLARLYHEHFLFMSVKGSRFDVRQPRQGKERRIGVLRGAVSGTLLKQYGYTHLVQASSVAECVRFLRGGIVDAIFGDRNIFLSALQGHDDSNYLFSEPLHSTTTWLGGSLDFSEAEAAQFQKAMKEMMDDGTYAQIVKKYGLAPGP